MVRKPVRPRAVPEQGKVAIRRIPVGFLPVRHIGDRVYAVTFRIRSRQPDRLVSTAGDTLAGVQADKLTSADAVKNAPDFGIIVRGDVGWCRPSLGRPSRLNRRR